MATAKRRARWAMLGVLGALALSGASRPRQVAAHAQEPQPPAPRATAVSLDADPAPPDAPPGVNRAPQLRIPGGDFLPFYRGKDGSKPVRVEAFRIDARPVTREAFLRFVTDHPRWRRSRIGRLFAEPSYLRDWAGDLDLGGGAPSEAVTEVAWFAAKAYCASIGERLPSTVEWERALKVIGPSFTVTIGSSPGANVAASLWEWTRDFNYLPLADGDVNDSAANLFCGAGARATDASDYGAFLRYSFRSSLKADFALKNLGFRCAVDGS
jgi:formylglycine-generating enzyme required for sulfatase activity